MVSAEPSGLAFALGQPVSGLCSLRRLIIKYAPVCAWRSVAVANCWAIGCTPNCGVKVLARIIVGLGVRSNMASGICDGIR